MFPTAVDDPIFNRNSIFACLNRNHSRARARSSSAPHQPMREYKSVNIILSLQNSSSVAFFMAKRIFLKTKVPLAREPLTEPERNQGKTRVKPA